MSRTSLRNTSVFGLSLFFGLTMTLTAAEPRAEQPTDGDRPALLSEAVPPLIGKFITKVGSDRELAPGEEGIVQGIIAGESEAGSFDVGMLIELLQPQAVRDMTGEAPLTILPPDDAENVEGGGEMLLVAGRLAVLKGGDVIPAGDELFPGDIIISGVILNAGDVPVDVMTADGQAVTLDPTDAAVAKSCETSCSVDVEDTANYYACCWQDDNGCMRCNSRANGEDPGMCRSGGPGTSSCSMNESAVADQL